MSNGTWLAIIIGGWILNIVIAKMLFFPKEEHKELHTEDIGEACWKGRP